MTNHNSEHEGIHGHVDPKSTWWTPCDCVRFVPIVGSYQGENVRSRPISETKHLWACSVLRWGTTRESQVLVRFYLLLPKPYPYLKFYVPFTHQVADPVAQWLRRVTTNHEIGGSSPSRNAF